MVLAGIICFLSAAGYIRWGLTQMGYFGTANPTPTPAAVSPAPK
jgi:hypothetical protein